VTPTVILALVPEESKTKMTCHNCRIGCSKAGKRIDGLQRYRCGQCGKTYSERKEFDNLFNQKQAVPDDKASVVTPNPANGGHPKSGQWNSRPKAGRSALETRSIEGDFRLFPSPVSKV
jgi:hypothetical protein